jgi:thymidylate synthase
MEITAINVNQLFQEGLWKFKVFGQDTKTRNGDAIMIAEPVTTEILLPTERVLFSKERDCNPIFHLMESIWILAGRRDVAFLEQFNSRMKQYSDDGIFFNAPYGYRMRHQFGLDQLEAVIMHLELNPDSRQAVIQLWDSQDLLRDTLDRACNTQMVFQVRHGRLNLTVFNRSNDFWYGYIGANIVHFTMIQEFVAIALGLGVGVYRTISTNLHVYKDLYDVSKHINSPPPAEDYDYYSAKLVRPRNLYEGSWKTFLTECELFCNEPMNPLDMKYEHSFFPEVAIPMAKIAFKRKYKISDGKEHLREIDAIDWRMAVKEFIDRREHGSK